MFTFLLKFITPKIQAWVTEGVEHLVAVFCVWWAAHGANAQQASGLQSLINPQSIAAIVVLFVNYGAAAYQKHQDLNAKPLPPTAPHGASSLLHLLVILFVAVGLSARAQSLQPGPTNAPAPLSTNSTIIQIPGLTIGGSFPTNVVKVANDLLTLASPLLPFITDIDGVALDADGLYADGHVGAVGMLSFNIPNFMTNVESVGIYGEYNPDENWYAGIAPVSLGMKLWTIPYLNIPITATAIPASASVRFKDSAWGSMSATGGCIVVPFGKSKVYLVIDGGKQWFTQANAKNPFYGGARLGYAFQ